VDFNNLSSNATSYQWSFPGAFPDTSTSADPQNICYLNSGTYDVTLIAINSNGTDTLTLSNYIFVYPTPPAPGFSQDGDTLFASGNSSTYQWFFFSDSIIGATDSFYVATQSGNYNITVTDVNGCDVGAGIINVIANIATPHLGEPWGEVFPNPSDKFLIINTTEFGKKEVNVLNSVGEKVKEFESSEQVIRLSTLDLPDGIFTLSVETDKRTKKIVFVVQH